MATDLFLIAKFDPKFAGVRMLAVAERLDLRESYTWDDELHRTGVEVVFVQTISNLVHEDKG